MEIGEIHKDPMLHDTPMISHVEHGKLHHFMIFGSGKTASALHLALKMNHMKILFYSTW
jgi:hypothetical protein